MRWLLAGMTFLSLLAGPITAFADQDRDTARDPETVIKDNCRQEAEGAGIAQDEMDDYIRQCIAQQKYWQEDNGPFGDPGDDNQGDDQGDDGSAGDDSPDDDSESDSWSSS